MLGRKDFTQDELDHARAAVDEGLAAYRRLAASVDGGGARAALDQLEPRFFNDLVLALDRRFVHRLRMVTGKDGTPLNELELLTESLLNNDGVLRTNNVIAYTPEESVLKLAPGDPIALSADGFERLAHGVLAELDAKFVHA
jgi:hypothetical protein